MKQIISTFALLFGAVLFMAVAHYSQALPSIEEYGKLSSISMMEISPSGNRIAFRKTEGGRELLLVYSREEHKVIRWVDVGELDSHELYFLNENTIVIVVSDYLRIRGYRGAHNISTAYRLDIKSGDLAQMLKPGYKIYLGQTGLGRVVGVSPDYKSVFMPAYTGSNHSENPPYSLMKVNLENPRNIKAIKTGKNSTVDYFLNRQGELVAEERYDDRRNLHSVIAYKNGKATTVYEREMDIRYVSFAGITPDAQHLVMLDEDPATKRTAYYLLSLVDGTITTTSTSREDKDVETLYVDTNRIVYGVRYSGFTPEYLFFDDSINRFVKGVTEKFSEHSVWLQSWSENWQEIVFMVEGSRYAGDYFIAGRKGNVEFVASARPGIASEDIQPIGTFGYIAGDGLKIPALATIPRSQSDNIKNLPAVIMPHGGPASYDRIGFDFLAQVLASRGYLVVQPQFRGSEGFGGNFVRAGHGEWGKKMQSDISDAVHFLTRKGMIDPKRVCIVGWSYGGYAALAGGAFTPDLYKCVVSINGVSDLPRMLSSEKTEHGKDSWILSYWEKAMANNEVNSNRLKAVSPVYHAENFQAPVLLIHGERDKVVPIKQSKVMYSRLKKLGKPVELIEAEDDNHSLIEGENRIEAVEAVVKFVQQHI